MKPCTLAMAVAVALIPRFAFADCNSELLGALRTKYTLAQDQTLAETIFWLTCNKSSGDRNTTLNISYKSFGLAPGQSDESTAEACLKNDTSFFSTNRQQIGLSFIPGKAIQGCFEGLSFTATQTPDGGVVTVTAAYAGKAPGEFAGIESVRWTPESAMKCSVDWAEKTIIPGGRNFICTRVQNVDVLFTLNTTAGQRQLVVRRSPLVEKRIMSWDYVPSLPDRQTETRCRNQFGELVGGWRSCYGDGTCNNREAIVAMCRNIYGSEYLTIDGQRVRN